MSDQPLLTGISPLIPAGASVETAIAFYEQSLGFTTVHTEGQPLRMAIVQRDAATLFLVQNDDRAIAEATSLRIQVQQIERLYAEIRQRGEQTIHPEGQLQTKPWGMKEFVVLDPAGVCLTFCEPAMV